MLLCAPVRRELLQVPFERRLGVNVSENLGYSIRLLGMNEETLEPF